MKPFIWDAHSCLPLDPKTPMGCLQEHMKGGVNYVSVNVGMDMNGLDQILRVIAGFRARIAARDDMVLTETLEEVHRAVQAGKLAVTFDLEGSVMLRDMPEMIGVFYRLGVRQIHLAYNRNNSIAGGCHDRDTGLTGLGRKMVAAINKAGMIMDCSHMSLSSSLDVCEVSCKPVVFSHVNPRALSGHERTVTDAQIKAAADTGGAVGISGVNRFLGVEGTPRPDDIVRHIDYVVDLVGVDHVGIGLDYMYEVPGCTDFPDGVDKGFWWPPERGYADFSAIEVLAPRHLGDVADIMATRGYTDQQIAQIMGGNFLRIAQESWIAPQNAL